MLKRGEGGIRTPDAGIADVTVFETAAFNHSATSPRQSVSTVSRSFNHTSVFTIVLYNLVPQPHVNSDSFSLHRSAIVGTQNRGQETKVLHTGVFLVLNKIGVMSSLIIEA